MIDFCRIGFFLVRTPLLKKLPSEFIPRHRTSVTVCRTETDRPFSVVNNCQYSSLKFFNIQTGDIALPAFHLFLHRWYQYNSDPSSLKTSPASAKIQMLPIGGEV